MPEAAQAEQRFTIDQLALAAGLTARNVRNYQSRGLIPPPEVKGRVGYYNTDHLARLQLISEMQAQGFNLAAIGHLLEQSTGATQEVLGFTRTLMAPFETETPEIISHQDLLARLGGEMEDRHIDKAEKLGLIIGLDNNHYEVPSPTLLMAGERLVKLGVPFKETLDLVDKLRRHVNQIADMFVGIFLEHIWRPFDDEGQPKTDWPRIQQALDELRPLATKSLTSVFEQTMTETVETTIGQELNHPRPRRA